MVNDFEWAILIPAPPLREGGKFIIDRHSSTENFWGEHEHIIFEVLSFGIGCISSELSGDNIGKDVMNFRILENTLEHPGTYVIDYHGELEMGTVKRLVKEGYWQPYYEKEI
jgi:hypothetical protein